MKHTVSEHELRNGARLLLIDIPGSQYFDMVVAIGAGYQTVAREHMRAALHVEQQPEEQPSPPYLAYEVPHVLEHMVFNGSTLYPDADDLHDIFTKHAGLWNGSTSARDTRFMFHNKPAHAEALIAAAINMIYHPTLSESSYNEERDIVRNELTDKMSDFSLNAALYTEQSITPDFIQSTDVYLETLDDVTYESVQAFHQSYYTSPNTTIIIARDPELVSQATIIEQLGAHMPPRSPGDMRAEQVIFPLDRDGPHVLIPIRTGRGGSNTYSKFTYRIPTVTNDKEGVLRRGLMRYLFMAMATNLKSYSVVYKLRKRGLAYDAVFMAERTAESEGISYMINAPNDSYIELMTQTIALTLELAQRGISDVQFETLRDELIDSIESSLDTPDAIMERYVDGYLDEGDLTNTPQVVGELQSISQQEMLAYIETIFQYNNQYGTLFSKKAFALAANTSITTEALFAGKPAPDLSVSSIVNSYYDTDPKATGIRKLTIAINSRPWLAWTLIVTQFIAGIALVAAWTIMNRDPGAPWWYLFILILGGYCIFEAGFDVLVRRHRFLKGKRQSK